MTAPTVWQTDAAGVLVGPVLASPSPLEPEVWLVPRGCVSVAPPSPGAGEQARWTGAEWVVEPAAPARWRVLRSNLVTRMTPEEAEQMEVVIATLPAQQRQRWLSARWLWSDDAQVLAVAAALDWPSERVVALLAPDDDPELAMLPAGAD